MEPDEVRSLAVFMVSQLPKMAPEDMLLVLGAAQTLVRVWYCQSAEVLPFIKPLGSSPRALASLTDKSPASPS